jgi:hypothetical protein
LEVKCMSYMALTHGAKAMLYFSYWPQDQRVWNSMGPLTREIRRISPFLVLPGKELLPVCTWKERVHTRCIKTGNSGLLIAANIDATFRDYTIKVPQIAGKTLDLPFENRKLAVGKTGEITEEFMPYEVHVYQWGETPKIPAGK